MDNNKEEWISVSELAERLGVSKQTVYNKVSNGEYKHKRFKRGKMSGLLICVPASNE